MIVSLIGTPLAIDDLMFGKLVFVFWFFIMSLNVIMVYLNLGFYVLAHLDIYV